MGLGHVKYLFGGTGKQLAAAALPLTLAPSLLPWSSRAADRSGNFFLWYSKGNILNVSFGGARRATNIRIRGFSELSGDVGAS